MATARSKALHKFVKGVSEIGQGKVGLNELDKKYSGGYGSRKGDMYFSEKHGKYIKR